MLYCGIFTNILTLKMLTTDKAAPQKSNGKNIEKMYEMSFYTVSYFQQKYFLCKDGLTFQLPVQVMCLQLMYTYKSYLIFNFGLRTIDLC